MRALLVLTIWAATASVALAQPKPGDSVTVTGAKDRLTVRRFVETFTAPTRITGKIARWEVGVCPVTVGLKPGFAKYVSQHVRDVAAQVGAPVDADTACKPNIEIVFTTKPQALADKVRKDHPGYLGYHDNAEQLAELARITRPIQAWYTNATMDLHGKMEIDSAKPAMGLEIWLPCPRTPGVCRMDLPYAAASAVTGSRALGDGLRSTFHHVIIVADPTKLLDHEIGTLADYIAMLALTQLSSLEVCQNLASVTSLLTPGCASSASALTVNDRGYLRGLYHMNPERALSVQEDQIAWQISREAGDAGQ